ncbi:MAG TPA: hypothetical protein VNG71_14880 [Pyrinomonadaceae bacterium]|nr:hypothetical protein [Pyrinomonadaceae bacterium]
MPSEKNKWIDAVGKLIALTQERKLIWRASSSSVFGVSYGLETDYAGKTLKLRTINDEGNVYSKLELQEPGSGEVWEFPYSEATEHLMDAARYQVVGVGEFLDELLNKSA